MKKEKDTYFDWDNFQVGRNKHFNSSPTLPRIKVKSVQIDTLKIPGKTVKNIPSFNQHTNHVIVHEFFAEIIPTRIEFDDIEIIATLSMLKIHKLMKMFNLQRKFDMNIILEDSKTKQIQSVNTIGHIREISTWENGDITLKFMPDYITIE